MILDDLVHHRKPDAGVGSLRLGGEERIEDAGQLLRFDTVSSVTHAEPKQLVFRARGFERQGTTRVHGRPGILD